MKTAGFTLIEILITLAIIGILASIAYPIYRNHLLKVHRTNAIVIINDLASQLEQQYNYDNSYKDANITIKPSNFYDFKISAEEHRYTIKAIPINSQIKDTQCGVLSLDNLGDKNVSGNSDVNDCW